MNPFFQLEQVKSMSFCIIFEGRRVVWHSDDDDDDVVQHIEVVSVDVERSSLRPSSSFSLCDRLVTVVRRRGAADLWLMSWGRLTFILSSSI